MTSPSAKAAQQIAQEAAKQILIQDADHAFWGDKYTEDRIAAIIQQALSDSLRPYRELERIIRAHINDDDYVDMDCFRSLLLKIQQVRTELEAQPAPRTYEVARALTVLDTLAPK